MWQTINTIPMPTDEWDYSYRAFLFYNSGYGAFVGKVIVTDKEMGDFIFTLGEYKVNPTHWMELPEAPKA